MRGIPVAELRERFSVVDGDIHIDGYGLVAATARHEARPFVHIYRGGNPIMLQLHRLRWILEYGWLPVGNRKDLLPGRVYYELDHVDGVTTNYRIDNLEVVTHEENMRRSFVKRGGKKIQSRRKALSANPPCATHTRYESDSDVQEQYPGISIERGFQGSEGFIPIEELREAFVHHDGALWREKDGGWDMVKTRGTGSNIQVRYDGGESGRNHKRVLAHHLVWALERSWVPARGCGYRFSAVNGDLRDYRLENLAVVKELRDGKTKALSKFRAQSKLLRTDKSLTAGSWQYKGLWEGFAGRVREAAEGRRREAWRLVDESVDLAALAEQYPGLRIERSLNGIDIDSFREGFRMAEGQVMRRKVWTGLSAVEHGRVFATYQGKYSIQASRLAWLLEYGWVPAARTPKGGVRYVIHHVNGDPRNNHINNLRCVTNAENIALVEEWPNRPGSGNTA